jgi:hypothetical protein
MVQLSFGSTQTVSAVVIAIGIRGRLRRIWFVVLGLDYVIDLASGFLVIQVMNLFLAGTCICQISFAIHVSGVSSHLSFPVQLGSYKLYGKLAIPFH